MGWSRWTHDGDVLPVTRLPNGNGKGRAEGREQATVVASELRRRTPGYEQVGSAHEPERGTRHEHGRESVESDAVKAVSGPERNQRSRAGQESGDAIACGW